MTQQGSDIARWIILYISIIAGEDADRLSLQAPLLEFDIDSLDAVEMAFEYEKRFNREVDPEIFMDSSKRIADLIEILA